MTFHVPNHCRVRSGPLGSDDSIGNAGAFFLGNRRSRENNAAPLKIIASDGEGWEHVSVSLPNRCPTWDEMCYVKGVFWDDDDCVVQFHPPTKEYVNNHPHCLHMWRPTGWNMPTPPGWMIGYQHLGVIA